MRDFNGEFGLTDEWFSQFLQNSSFSSIDGWERNGNVFTNRIGSEKCYLVLTQGRMNFILNGVFVDYESRKPRILGEIVVELPYQRLRFELTKSGRPIYSRLEIASPGCSNSPILELYREIEEKYKRKRRNKSRPSRLQELDAMSETRLDLPKDRYD